MPSPQLNPCSACTLRYGTDDINQLNTCCYNTCASFISGNQSDIVNSDCGKKCFECMQNAVKCDGRTPCEFMPEVPVIQLQQQQFKQCLADTNGDTTKALKCCLANCSNWEEQEHCIDAFNATIQVKEGFLFRHNMINRSFLFLVFVVCLQILQVYGPIGWLKKKNQIGVVPVTIIMYYLLEYFL